MSTSRSLASDHQCQSGDWCNDYNKGKFAEIQEIFLKLKNCYGDRFYIEIQRHGDLNEKEFEKFNLKCSKTLDIPLIATNEVFYIDKDLSFSHACKVLNADGERGLNSSCSLPNRVVSRTVPLVSTLSPSQAMNSPNLEDLQEPTCIYF